MSKQKTQGKTTKSNATTTKKTENKAEILRVKAGYCQHTSPHKTKGFEKANVASTTLKFQLD